MAGTLELGGHGAGVALDQVAYEHVGAAREPRGARSRGDLQELADVGGVALRSSVSFHGTCVRPNRDQRMIQRPLGSQAERPSVVLASLGGARLLQRSVSGRSSPRRSAVGSVVEVLGGAVLVVELGDADRTGHRDAGGEPGAPGALPHLGAEVDRTGHGVSGHRMRTRRPRAGRRSRSAAPGPRGPHAHAQHRITGVVPVEVVDRLEVVEVAHDDRQRLAGAAGPQELAREALLPRPPVADRRERVLG